MRRSNFMGKVRKVLTSPALIAGISFGTFVCLNSVSAREHHEHHFSEHRFSHVRYSARFAGHHLMPMQASNGSFGFGGYGQYGFGSSGQSGFTSFGRSSPAYGGGISSMAAAQASAAGVPQSLVERVIRRESGGNPRAVHAGNYGLMQIRLGTARAMGYTGSAAGLLDPQTNMTYAVRYLAGAYRAAGGNESRAVALYARGYYAQAKARGFSPYASTSLSTPEARYLPVMFSMGQPAAAPVYRVRHIRRHAV